MIIAFIFGFFLFVFFVFLVKNHGEEDHSNPYEDLDNYYLKQEEEKEKEDRRGYK